MTTSGLAWKLNRLRTMGSAELGWRVVQALQGKLEASGVGRVKSIPPAREAPGAAWVQRPSRVDASVLRAAADRVLEGRFNVFALDEAPLGFPPNWNRDPRTGTVAPMVFGKTLNYRDPEQVGDIKYLWEPSRHLELVTLAQAWALTGESRHALGARRLLASWFDQCPYPMGVHWTSSLEHAVRLMNWSVAWQLLDGSPAFDGDEGAAFRQRWLGFIYLHQRFIAGHFSRHSSANNHLFGEYMGLFIGALTWPCWPESARWEQLGRAGLEAEAPKQTASDGVNLEQGIWYHHEVADMMLLTSRAALAAGRGMSAGYLQRLESMLVFVASLMDVGHQLPMWGDSDDAVMVRFDPSPAFCPYRSLLATGAVLFGRADLARKAGRWDDKSRWLLGDDAEGAFERLRLAPASSAPALPRQFPEGGYWVMGDRLDQPDEVRLVADAGPLGYLSIAAHGHADALSFTLGMSGRELLIDPGTYAYHTQRRWRDYFKGTSAHNTVRVDGVDQSVSGGNFMWLRHAQARCTEFTTGPTLDRFSGEHDGYTRLADPVTHRRTIEFDKVAGLVTVTDTVECRGAHDIEVHWHLAERCEAELDGAGVAVTDGVVGMQLSLEGVSFQAEVVRGREDPPLGWVSRRFDRKEPVNCVRWHGRVEGTTRWRTQIRLKPPISGTGLES